MYIRSGNLEEIKRLSYVKFHTERNSNSVYAMFYEKDEDLDLNEDPHDSVYISKPLLSIEPIFKTDKSYPILDFVRISFVGWKGNQYCVDVPHRKLGWDTSQLFEELHNLGFIVEPQVEDLFILYLYREINKQTA